MNILNEILATYNQLNLEDTLHIPSSNIKINFHSIKESKNRGVIPSIGKFQLELDVYAVNDREGISITTAYLANTRLRSGKSFGTRHGSLLYALPIIHLLGFLLGITVVGINFGLIYGVILGLTAILTIIILINWIATSLEIRRRILKQNLELTGKYENSAEIDEMVSWLKAKHHPRSYWLKRLLFYEIYYITITVLFLIIISQQ